MSYIQGNLIEATDYNDFVGPANETLPNKLNSIWATGAASWGYGQSAVAQVAVAGTVAASNWATLVNTQANIAAHQGTSITPVTAPSAGQTVAVVAAIPTNLTSINNSRLNAAAQGPTFANVATYLNSWTSALTFTHTVSFANGDAARYFFNAGGQLSLTTSHPTGADINGLLNQLCLDIGTIAISSVNGGTVSIVGTSYTGITKIGGGGNAPSVFLPNYGYYNFTASPAEVFKQTAASGPASYLGSFISISINSNGTQGSNSDRGSIITITTTWDEVPNGLVANPGSTTTVTVRPPSTTYLANTWGSIGLTGTVSGS